MIDMTNPRPPTVPQDAPEVTQGRLVGRTFSTWWRQKWRLAATTLVIMIPVYALLFAVMVAFRPDPYADGEFSPRSVVVMAFGAVAMLAMMAQACSHTYGAFAHLSGQPVRLGTMLSVALGRLPTLFALLVLGLVAYVVFAVVVGLLTALLFQILGQGGAFIVLALILVPIVCVLGTALSLTLPAVAAERAGPFRAIARSWRLSRDRRAAIFFTYLLVAVLLAGFLYGTVRLLIAIQVAGAEQAFGYGWFAAVVQVGAALIVGAAQLMVFPLFTVIPGVAYHDVRIEKEGTSTEELARVFG